MSTILAHITIRAGMETEWEAVARDLYAASHASETGLLRYEYWRGAEERTYYTLLSFEDQRAFVDHQTSDHHESAAPDIGRMVEAIRLEWVDPVDGASPLPPTEPQDAPADADELTQRYTTSYAAQLQAWWTPLRDAAAAASGSSA